MEFSNPLALWGLLGIAIPIAIHLLQLRRYKTILFSDVRFLKNIQRSAKKQQQIRHWVILLARILAWSALTLAFAIPFLDDEDDALKSSDTIILYIDNSPSMVRKGESGPLWAQAVQNARSVVRANDGSTFYILTSNGEGREMIPRTSAVALEEIQSIQPGNASTTWQDVLDRLSTLGLKDSSQVYLFSDDQATNLTNEIDDNGLPITLIPVVYQAVSSVPNASIDSAWIASPVVMPGQKLDIQYTISASDDVKDLQLELLVGNEVRGVQSLSLIEEESTITGTLSFNAPQDRFLQVELRINDGALEHDNLYPLSIQLRRSLRLLHIESSTLPGVAVDSLINDSAYTVTITNYSRVPYGELGSYDLIVLDRTSEWPEGLSSGLNKAVSQGSSILVFGEGPSSNDLGVLQIADFGSRDTSFNSRLILNTDRDFFSGVFYEEPERVQFPELISAHPITSTYGSLGGVSLMQRANGSPHMVQYDRGIGQIYQWESHPIAEQNGWSDLYTVLFYQMAIYKGQTSWNSVSITEDRTLTFEYESGSSEPIVTLVQDSLKVIPPQIDRGGSIEIQTRNFGFDPGFVHVVMENDTIGVIAYHTGRAESQLRSAKKDQIESALSATDHRITEATSVDDADTKLRQLTERRSQSNAWIWTTIIVLLLEMILWRQPKS